MSDASEKALAAFTDYFIRNYPGPDTIISDPRWHAPRIFRAVMKALDEAAVNAAPNYQHRTNDWMLTCFGPTVAADLKERPHRFLEEALELAQSVGCTKRDALQLVCYVFGRPAGEPHQEAGAVLLTLAALCTAIGVSMDDAAEAELARVSTPEMVARLRAKNAAKDTDSPLPGIVPAPGDEA